MHGCFSLVAQFFHAQYHMGIGDIIKMALQAFHFTINILAQWVC